MFQRGHPPRDACHACARAQCSGGGAFLRQRGTMQPRQDGRNRNPVNDPRDKASSGASYPAALVHIASLSCLFGCSLPERKVQMRRGGWVPLSCPRARRAASGGIGQAVSVAPLGCGGDTAAWLHLSFSKSPAALALEARPGPARPVHASCAWSPPPAWCRRLGDAGWPMPRLAWPWR